MRIRLAALVLLLLLPACGAWPADPPAEAAAVAEEEVAPGLLETMSCRRRTSVDFRSDFA